jgi:replicative DNA helicase
MSHRRKVCNIADDAKKKATDTSTDISTELIKVNSDIEKIADFNSSLEFSNIKDVTMTSVEKIIANTEKGGISGLSETFFQQI